MITRSPLAIPFDTCAPGRSPTLRGGRHRCVLAPGWLFVSLQCRDEQFVVAVRLARVDMHALARFAGNNLDERLPTLRLKRCLQLVG